MMRLRTRLLFAMLAVVLLTIGISGVFTRRVTHEELRRFTVLGHAPDITPLDAYYRAHGSWSGVGAVIERMPARIVMTTPQRTVIATSADLRGKTIVLPADDVIEISGPGMRMKFKVAPERAGDANVYVLPRADDVEPSAALDRRLVIGFAGAALAAIVLALLISSRITRRIEHLTDAVETMARGSMPAHVTVGGRDEIAHLAQSFNAMADAIAQQQTLRRRMVTDVAHELRTPLTNLRCEIEAMQDGLARPDPSQIASLHEEVIHLARLVEDLQELALAESGGLVLKRESIDLGSTVERAARGFGNRVHVAVEPVTVSADPLRIGQIVRNLVANAVRHARNRVDVAVRSEAGRALVVVADDGPGIPPSELSHVFERFYRVDGARNRSHGGAGLGLSIVKSLVELHGGSVCAANRAEGGAEFTFAMPAD